MATLNAYQAVRDDDHRDRPAQRVQCLDDPPLGALVEVRGRLVEHEHARMRVQRARKADPLPLTAGKAHAALADDRLDALRQARHDVVETSQTDRLDDTLVVDLVAVPTERDVRPNRVVDEVHVLRHVADRPLPRLREARLSGDAVDGDAARDPGRACRGSRRAACSCRNRSGRRSRTTPRGGRERHLA